MTLDTPAAPAVVHAGALADSLQVEPLTCAIGAEIRVGGAWQAMVVKGDQIYMVQCHNLEHETHGMMVNFRVAD